jgi:hypothetical protein
LKRAIKALRDVISSVSEEAALALCSAMDEFCCVVSSMRAMAWLISSMPWACSCVAMEISSTVPATRLVEPKTRSSTSPAERTSRTPSTTSEDDLRN